MKITSCRVHLEYAGWFDIHRLINDICISINLRKITWSYKQMQKIYLIKLNMLSWKSAGEVKNGWNILQSNKHHVHNLFLKLSYMGKWKSLSKTIKNETRMSTITSVIQYSAPKQGMKLGNKKSKYSYFQKTWIHN